MDAFRAASILFIILLPLAALRGLWTYARHVTPSFRIQYTVLELWVLALCYSPTALLAAWWMQQDPSTITAVWIVAFLLHQTAGVFFMYVVERLSVKSCPMPLILIAGNLIGVTLFPAITAFLLALGAILYTFAMGV